MTHRTSLWFSFTALFTVLSSCQDHKIPDAQRFRITKATFVVNTNMRYTVYAYDANNRLTSTRDYTPVSGQTPFLTRETIYSYDEKSRLTKSESNLYSLTPPNPLIDSYTRITYDYDGNNHITAIKKYNVLKADPTSSLLTEDYLITYGNGDLPVKIRAKFNTGSQFDPQIDRTDEYTYSNGDVVAINSAYAPTRSNGYTASTSATTLQYDDKINPFYGLIPDVPDTKFFSKNNQTDSGKSYTYNANGLPVQIRDGSSTSTYEYEPY